MDARSVEQDNWEEYLVDLVIVFLRWKIFGMVTMMMLYTDEAITFIRFGGDIQCLEDWGDPKISRK